MTFQNLPPHGLTSEVNDLGNVTGVLPLANGGTNSSSDLNNGRVMASSGGAIIEAATTSAQLASMPIWTKYSVLHTALQTADVTNNIELFSLPAKTVIHKVIIKQTTAFLGCATYTISVGIAGTLAKYIAAYDVTAAVAATTFGVSLATVNATLENFSSAASIKIAATSTIQNLSSSSAGAVDVYVLTSTLP